METLTTQELIKKANQYDRIHNEGGYGYNPYRSEIERREIESEASRVKSPAERKSEIYRELERLDCSIAIESGTYDQDKTDSLRAKLKEIESAEKDAFAAEWTLSVTKARRESWNSFVKKTMTGRKKINAEIARKITVRQEEQGWQMDDLKKAVKMHNL